MFSGILEFFMDFWAGVSSNCGIDKWLPHLPAEASSVVVSWTILFLLLLILFMGVAILSRRSASKIISSLSHHLFLVSLLIWVCGVVVYIVGFYNSTLNWFGVLPRAVISSFRMFVVANELARVEPELHENALYMACFSIIHFSAACITFLFIFKLLGYKIKSSLRIFWHRFTCRSKGGVVHLFWGVNEASCLLAEDIRRCHNTETIIFIDIDAEGEESAQKKLSLNRITNTITLKNSEIERLEAIDALVAHCYNGPATLADDGVADIFRALHLRSVGAIVRRCGKLHNYFLSDDEVQNITGALKLQRDVRLCAKCEDSAYIYVHARRDANNEIFDHYSQYDSTKQCVKIKIIDSAYLSVASMKDCAEMLPVSCVKPTKALVDEPFNAMIVGFGATGQEAFKFLYEFATFVDSNLNKSAFKCCAIDSNMEQIRGLIRTKMPRIGEDELQLIRDTVDSQSFWDRVTESIDELNYVVISLNNDTLGLTLAVHLFKYAVKSRSSQHRMLKIMLRGYERCNERRMAEVVAKLNNSIDGRNVKIYLFGLERDIYTCETILQDKMLKRAKLFNLIYENANREPSKPQESSADNQWTKDFGNATIPNIMARNGITRYHAIYDINRRIAQNISNAQHCRTKIMLMGLDSSADPDRLRLYYGYANSRAKGTTTYDCSREDAELLRNMAITEHERWMSSHKLMGYAEGDDTDYVRKLHRNMKPWDKLSMQYQSYDSNVVDTTIKMAYKGEL